MAQYDFIAKFPHFKTAESVVLKRFLDLSLLQGKITYDVHLNIPMKPFPWWTTIEDQAILQHIHAKRIDLTIETSDTIWILEVKDILRASGIGQVLLYRYMYRNLFSPTKNLRMGMIAGKDDASVHAAATEASIMVWIV